MSDQQIFFVRKLNEKIFFFIINFYDYMQYYPRFDRGNVLKLSMGFHNIFHGNLSERNRKSPNNGIWL